MILRFKEQLTEYLQQGCKPVSQWRIGAEHEKFIFSSAGQRLGYEGRGGIQNILENLQQFGWRPTHEEGRLIALERQGSTITLEPGGQLELSTAPLLDLHHVAALTEKHFQELHAILDPQGLQMVSCGFDPVTPKDDVPWMPKKRYGIMRNYMPQQGALGTDMMTRTCTVQVNLDYRSEEDMVIKMRVAMAIQSIVSAMFAYSPFMNGSPIQNPKGNFLTYRTYVWQDTDPQRCGLLPFVFDENMGFARYVDYMLTVPLYFIRREGRYINVAGQSFRDFMKGHLPGLPNEYPTLEDWQDHLTTAFPQVRLKQYIEMRGADAGPLSYLHALPALWTGLLYDAHSLQEASTLIESWTGADLETLYQDIPFKALQATLRGRAVQEIALEILSIAEKGLVRRGLKNQTGDDESCYLIALKDKVSQGKTLAEIWLEDYHKTGKIVLPLI